MRQSCDSFCVHNLQETTFVCTIATYNFCLHYCNWKHFKHYSNCWLLFALLQLPTFYRKKPFVWTTATITIHHIITVINFWMHNGNWHLFMHYCNWLLLYALLKLTTFFWTVATACCRPALTTSVTLIATKHINS